MSIEKIKKVIDEDSIENIDIELTDHLINTLNQDIDALYTKYSTKKEDRN